MATIEFSSAAVENQPLLSHYCSDCNDTVVIQKETSKSKIYMDGIVFT